MLGIYLSGTGNTEHCIIKLVRLLDKTAEIVPVEDKSVIEKIKNSDTTLFIKL